MGTPFESIVAEWGVLFLTDKNLKRGRTKGTLLQASFLSAHVWQRKGEMECGYGMDRYKKLPVTNQVMKGEIVFGEEI